MDDFVGFENGNESSSFEDAIDDSDQSNSSDSEQSCALRHYWQDWEKPGTDVKPLDITPKNVPKLLDLCAPIAARSMSFDQLEQNNQYIETKKKWHDIMSLLPGIETMSYAEIQAAYERFSKNEPRAPIPEKIIIPIIRVCFPENDNDIRLYSCLANGSTNSFKTGQTIFKENYVLNMVQIGYFISATVQMSMYDDGKFRTNNKSNTTDMYETFFTPNSSNKVYHVAISVDRCRIISATCTCEQSTWCHHIVASCLYRLHKADKVEYRATIWDSVNELSAMKLKKLSQWFINELPREFLPVAQRLIDELRDPKSIINLASGAPDPTDGGHDDVPIWSMDPKAIHNKIGTILIKFVKPSPIVHCDVQMLNSEPQPPVANEYKIRRTVLKSKQPSSLWNFFGIVREMFRRHDENATTLLHMITADCLAVDQIILFWYEAKLLESGKWHMQLASAKSTRSMQRNSFVQLLYEANALFDEIVKLWKVAALNPRLSVGEREQLSGLLQLYHRQAVSQIWRSIKKNDAQMHLKMMVNSGGQFLSLYTASFTSEFFPGFHAALEACQVDFKSVELRGIPLPPLYQPFNETEYANLPLLRNNRKYFMKELKSARMVTMVILGGEEAQGASTAVMSNRRQKSKKKKRQSHATRRTSSNLLSNMSIPSSSTAVSSTLNYTQNSEFSDDEGVNEENNEPYDLELSELFALSHVEREPLQIRMDAGDALAHHGYPAEATYMAIKVARELLQNMPNVLYNGVTYSNNIIECATVAVEDYYNSSKRNRRPMFSGVLLARQIDSCPQKVEVQMPCSEALKATRQAVETMERCLRLMQILLSGPEETSTYRVKDTVITSSQTRFLALELGTTALGLLRYPAPTHQLEVLLNYLESEVYDVLQTIELTPEHLDFLRKVAFKTINRCQHTNTDTIPPIMLAMYLLDALKPKNGIAEIDSLLHSDHECLLSYQVALLCLESKLSYVEEDFPMMFECVRKQRRLLAVTLITLFKDNITLLGLVLDRLLDPSIHRMYDDHDSNASFFLEKDNLYVRYAISGQRPVFPIPTSNVKCNRQYSNSSEYSQESAGSSGSFNEYQGENVSDSSRNIGKKSIPSLFDVMRTNCTTVKVAPHATEALSQFYADLAQKILHEAGGTVSSSIFTASNANGNMNNHNMRTHRHLHMCAFIIGMYAVGIHNSTSRNWMTRTQFGFNVGWLQTQALEIGTPALNLVRQVWQKHFTANEVAGLADKASHRADREIIQQGAMLAVSALYKAHLLNSNEAIIRLRQCREFSMELTEQACIAVEAVACEQSSFYPNVLFQAARYWFDVHDSIQNEQIAAANSNAQMLQQQQQQYYAAQEQQYQAAHPYGNGYYQQQGHNNQYGGNGVMGLHPSHSAPNLNPQNGISFPYLQDNGGNGYYHGQQSYSNYNHNGVGNYSQHGNSMQVGCYTNMMNVADQRMLNSYRVGMLAMKTMRLVEMEEKKLFEDHLYSSPFEDDLKFLLNICHRLGILYVNSFYQHVAAYVQSPHLLYPFIKESIQFYGYNRCPGTIAVMQLNTGAYYEQPPITPVHTTSCMPRYGPQNQQQNGSQSATPMNKINCSQQFGLYVDLTKIATGIRHSMTSYNYHELTMALLCRSIDMCYIGVQYRLNFPRLQDSDCEVLRRLLSVARLSFRLIPNGRNYYDAYIRYWRTKSCKKKIGTHEQIKQVFDEFVDFTCVNEIDG